MAGSERARGAAALGARLGLYGLLLWAPLPLAGNRPVFWVVNGFWISAVLLAFIAGEIGNRRALALDWRPIMAWTAGSAALTVWIAIQAMPHMPASLRHPLWDELAAGFPDARNSISIDPAATMASLALFAPIAFLAPVGWRIAVDPRRARLVTVLVAAAATAVAVWGLVALGSGWRQAFLAETDAYAGYLTGTFVNRNTAAAYFGLGLVAALSLVMTRIGPSGRSGRLSATVLPLAAIAILLTAVLATGSRGGALAAAVGALAVIIISARRLRRSGLRRRSVIAAVLVTIAALIAIALLAGDAVVGRLERSLGDEARLALYRDVLALIAGRPLLGHGAGSFATIYPLAHGGGVSPELVWLRAHSTWLQAALELGLPALLLLIILAGSLLTVLVRAAGSAHAPAALAAVGASVLIGVHSFVDFSLQIEAIAITVVAMIGAGLGEAARLAPKVRHGERRTVGSDPRGAPSTDKVETEIIDVTVPPRPISGQDDRSRAARPPAGGS